MATENDLAAAAEQVAKAKRIVARQREAIARLKAQRRPTFDAEETLEVFSERSTCLSGMNASCGMAGGCQKRAGKRAARRAVHPSARPAEIQRSALRCFRRAP